MGATRGRLSVFLGKKCHVLLDDVGVLGISCEIVPFIRVLAHIIEFLISICVLDEAPVLATDAVIIVVMGGDGGPLAVGIGILELWHKAVSLELAVCREVAEFGEGRVDIKQFSWFSTELSWLDSRSCENEGDSCAVIPEGVLAGD